MTTRIEVAPKIVFHRHPSLSEYHEGIAISRSARQLSRRVQTDSLAGLLSFAAFLVLGFSIYRDYGVSWDERSHLFGFMHVYRRILWGTPLPALDVIYYGPFFDSLAWLVWVVTGAGDIGSYYYTKHIVNFLFFSAAVASFYALCSMYFRDRIKGYIAAVLLILHPRIFAEAFYNPKDLPFLSSFVIACFTLQRSIARRSTTGALLHGLASGICIDIRVLGALVPALTILVSVVEAWQNRIDRDAVKKIGLNSLWYVGLTCCFAVLLHPYLWLDPIGNFLQICHLMSQFNWPGSNLYFGEWVLGSKVPWHYAIVWILITSPLTIVCLFFIGLCRIPAHVKDFLFDGQSKGPFQFVPFLWFVIPLMAVMLLHSTLYGGWRHLYFVYPAMVIIAVIGVDWLMDLYKRVKPSQIAKGVAALSIVLAAADLGSVALFMIRSHPHQYVYFNALVGGPRGAKFKFEMDYWGVSYKSLLTELAHVIPSEEPINIVGATPPVKEALLMLSPKERGKFMFYEKAESIPKGSVYYFLTVFRNTPKDWQPPGAEICEVEVAGAKVAAAYLVP